MRYVLDTSVFSALMAEEEGPLVRLEALRPSNVLLPQPVLAEVSAGLARLPRSRREQLLRHRFEVLCTTFPRSAWTDEVSHCFGVLKASLLRRGASVEDFDLAIAAHALVEDAILVTDNVRHFDRVAGLTVENWRRSH